MLAPEQFQILQILFTTNTWGPVILKQSGSQRHLILTEDGTQTKTEEFISVTRQKKYFK